MLHLKRLHHISIICSDFEKSKAFYTGILGLKIAREIYREERQSFKADLELNGSYVIELFSFPSPPARVSQPEAAGLRHLAFEVDNLEEMIRVLKQNNLRAEEIRTDSVTGKRFTFFEDPDKLPIELYES